MQVILETQRRPVAFRFELRRATRSEHQSLDEHPAFTALAAGRLGLEGYRQLMALFHGLYAGLDASLDDSCHRLLPPGCEYSYVRREPFLARDASDLRATTAPPAKAPQPYGSLAGLCGALYVVEGSLLGGAMLQRATAALLADHGERGDAYWRWCRDAGGPRWAATCGLIEESASTARSRDEMILGARETFDLFSDWFGRWQDKASYEPASMRQTTC